jgi:hypothetical protein
MSESIQTAAGQNPKLLIATALITAMTTIGAALVGVFPQVWGRNAAVNKETVPAQSVKKIAIDGAVKSNDATRVMNGINVYLLPAGKVLETQTDDSGKFVFDDVPSGEYSIIFRETPNGLSGKGFLDGDIGEAPTLDGWSIKFRKRPKGGTE